MSAGVLLALALASAPTREDNPSFRAAVTAWEEGRWDDAAVAFAAAYEVDPRPEYVFARARALRLAGDCAAAIPVFERFIALAPPPTAIDDARTNIRECGAEPTANDEANAPATPPAAASVDASPDASPPVRPAPRPWGRDPLGHALVWPGVAVLGTGVGLLVAAHVRRARADRESVEDDYRDAIRVAPAMSKIGIALASIGGALVVAGVVRFAVLGARQRRSPPRAVAFALDAAGVGLAW